MDLLTPEYVKFTTKLKKDEIIRRLTDAIEPERSVSSKLWDISSKPFEGRIDEECFNIRILANSNIGHYYNDTRPEITGFITSELPGSVISVKMGLHSYVTIFILILFSGIGLAAGVGIDSAHIPKFSDYNFAVLLSLALFLYAYGMIYVGFIGGMDKAKTQLAALFEAEIID